MCDLNNGVVILAAWASKSDDEGESLLTNALDFQHVYSEAVAFTKVGRGYEIQGESVAPLKHITVRRWYNVGRSCSREYLASFMRRDMALTRCLSGLHGPDANISMA